MPHTNAAEMRARHIFNTYNLKDENEEVKRNLMILLLTTPRRSRRNVSYEDALNSLEGAWENDGMVAEEEIDEIYNARTTGETRKIVEL